MALIVIDRTNPESHETLIEGTQEYNEAIERLAKISQVPNQVAEKTLKSGMQMSTAGAIYEIVPVEVSPKQGE